MNRELPDVQAGFRKGRRARDQIANIRWVIEKAREFQKNIYFCFIDYAKAFHCVNHNKLWKIFQEMGIPDHLICLLRNLYAGQEATVRTGLGQGAACAPRPLTWSPHAGVNHAARPAGLGEQLCHLPALSGGQALAAGSHPGRKPQGPPPSEGKIPVPEGPPQPAADPKSCCVCVYVCWGSGGGGR